MQNNKLDWVVAIALICFGAYLMFSDRGHNQTPIIIKGKPDTTYIVREYIRDTIVNVVRPRYYDTTIVNNITIIDSVYTTKPFSLTDTTITKKNDTMETIAKFPQMSITHLFRYSKDSVRTINRTDSLIVRIPLTNPWWYTPALIGGGTVVGFIISEVLQIARKK